MKTKTLVVERYIPFGTSSFIVDYLYRSKLLFGSYDFAMRSNINCAVQWARNQGFTHIEFTGSWPDDLPRRAAVDSQMLLQWSAQRSVGRALSFALIRK